MAAVELDRFRGRSSFEVKGFASSKIRPLAHTKVHTHGRY